MPREMCPPWLSNTGGWPTEYVTEQSNSIRQGTLPHSEDIQLWFWLTNSIEAERATTYVHVTSITNTNLKLESVCSGSSFDIFVAAAHCQSVHSVCRATPGNSARKLLALQTAAACKRSLVRRLIWPSASTSPFDLLCGQDC
jgi:hypothetical protein